VADEISTLSATLPDSLELQRAIYAADMATASMAAADRDGDVELARDVAAAELALHGVDWPGRVASAMERIDEQAVEFASQLQHLKDNGALPSEVQMVAVEQLLDAIGAIAVAVQGLLVQAEQEAARSVWRHLDDRDGLMLPKLLPELRRLPAAVATVRRWGLVVPPELLLVNVDELRSMPLAATDPTASTAHGGATVQRVIGALIVTGGEAALERVAWVTFDDKGNPVLPRCKTPMGSKPTITRPPAVAVDSACANLEAALTVYSERVTAATSQLVPAVLDDVTAYARAKAAALAQPGASAASAELEQLTKRVPQSYDPLSNDGGNNSTPSLAQAKELVLQADSHAPPPTALAHAVHKQLRAAAGSKYLYTVISAAARRAGVELVVLPGGVKKLPRTIFKCAVNYCCNLSEINDQVQYPPKMMGVNKFFVANVVIAQRRTHTEFQINSQFGF